MSKAGVRDRSRMRGGVPRHRAGGRRVARAARSSRQVRRPASGPAGRGSARLCNGRRPRGEMERSPRAMNRGDDRNSSDRRRSTVVEYRAQATGRTWVSRRFFAALRSWAGLRLDRGPVGAVHGVEAAGTSAFQAPRRRWRPAAAVATRRATHRRGRATAGRAATPRSISLLMRNALAPVCSIPEVPRTRRSIYAVRCN